MAELNPDINDFGSNIPKRNTPRINCVKCVFYEVTWDPDHPRGCVLFGFKGKQMPSEMVLLSTGRPCPSFKPKH